ncbi:MAG: aryl-sulfate sulfotransferase [Bacteroidota bacterium]
MKTILSFIILLCSWQIAAAQSPGFQYVSPKPNSILVSSETNIILKSSSVVERSSISSNLFRVEGTLSGVHDGTTILTDDGRTIVFNPFVPFSGDEIVSVLTQSDIGTVRGTIPAGYSFQFTTMPQSAKILRKMPTESELAEYRSSAAYLPAPPITIDSVNNPSPGYIFLATWDRNVPIHNYANYLFILDSSGKILDSTRVIGAPFDFQIQPNGMLSYGLGDYIGNTPGNGNLRHFVLDSTLAKVDSFQMKNGYFTDFHDFILLPNGHAMMMSYHTVTYDLSKVVPGGKTDALLVIDVFQEQDKDKNVVFEWRDIDYIPITDTDLKLTDPRVNPSTLNAFELDDDGNLLMSFRNHSDIMKISRETGEVMWKFGGLKNEFTFVGEHKENAPYYFARQHDIHRLPNGHISLFDNGEFHSPWYSRAVEYELDEVNKVATLVSEYRYTSGNISAQAAGNAHRLPNGGWFVGFGILDPTSPVMRNIVESHADGTTAFELSMPTNVISYRTSKQPWRQLVRTVFVSIAEVLETNTYVFAKNGDTTGVSVRFEQLVGDSYNSVSIKRIPYGPVTPEFVSDAPIIAPVSIIYSGAAISSHISEVHIDLKKYPEIKHPALTSIFVREFPGQGLFVELPTVFDSTAHELIASTTKFGEIVFGTSDLRQGQAIPVLIEPLNNRKILASKPVLLKWGGHGLLQSFELQISTDSMFVTTVLDSILKNSFVQRSGFAKNQKYYWRVRANAANDTTNWSPVWRFEPADAFVALQTPDGGEKYEIGKPVIIRWASNISDSVKVYLLRGFSSAGILGKTSARNNAFIWNVGAALAVDSIYRIVITSLLDSTLADTSYYAFTLYKVTNVETAGGKTPDGFELSQNYPNPFNPNTVIQFQIPEDHFVTLKLFDILGNTVNTLVQQPMRAGIHRIDVNASSLPSGTYFYRIHAGQYSDTKKMILMK